VKEKVADAFRNFFIIVTLINVAMLVLGSILKPDQKFGYEAFAYPLIYGAITSIPGLCMGSKKEMTIPQTIIREIIQLILIIIVLLVIMFGKSPITKETILATLSVATSVIVVFGLVNLIGWLLDRRTARSLTADLEAYQKANNN
jgi:peptidoglycan/LPS O-acetylase OafA/YrhL